MTDIPDTDDFAARRAAARQALSAIDPHLNGDAAPDPFRQGWFNAVYTNADGDAAKVPWADLAAHPLTAEWIAGADGGLAGLAVLDVGCGLGDNAEAFAAAGCHTAAFDLVPRAVAWARQRFPDTSVDYRVADLFALPDEWRGAFDLVHECYTLQALPAELVAPAAAAIAACLCPGGGVLVIARARAADAPRVGPPWPLTRGDLAAFEAAGLRAVCIEELVSEDRPHWRALFEKPAA